MHWHYVHKIVEFDEIAQADELSFCVRLEPSTGPPELSSINKVSLV